MRREMEIGIVCAGLFLLGTLIHGEAAEPKGQKATIEMEAGRIVIELYDKDAPGTVANFVKLAKNGFYNGLKFHRVEPG